MMVSYSFISFGFGSGFLALVVFFILQWLQIPAGSLVDWLVGIASFWWLLAVVTIPWNIYFEAEETKAEAVISRQKNIPVDAQQLAYVAKIARFGLLLAITLHLLSALGLYGLAAWGISPVGYVTGGAMLLLTALRPAVRAYQFIAQRLMSIRQQIQYPREDVVELRHRVVTLEAGVKNLQETTEKNSQTHQEEWHSLRRDLAKMRAALEQLEATNEAAHRQLAREATTAIAQLSEDSQVLNHVRAIIHFWKQA
ncbi:hypothetical protein [Picosynechococcus sp. PCC 73109]|uniref:hypothetical protein n=1 Tax=Picosynechococcus sp. PCC 73109 TaxID=374982 RepID=UPI00403FA689